MTAVPEFPLASLPRVDRREARMGRVFDAGWLLDAVRPITEPLGLDVEIGRPEFRKRAAGLGRPGAIAQLAWPRFDAALALAIEVPLAHAIVDRLLGFDRFDGQKHLQITPVEWGLLAYLAARVLALLTTHDLVLDRVGPDAFRIEGPDPVVTLKYPVRIGETSGSARLWISESLYDLLSTFRATETTISHEFFREVLSALTIDWTAEIGEIAMPRGLAKLRAGGVLPIARKDSEPLGTQTQRRFTLLNTTHTHVYRLSVDYLSGSAATVAAPVRVEPLLRKPSQMSISEHIDPNATDLPVTLTVELGRVSLPLGRVAGLKPGDVLELGRRAREPVDLTSGGRLVARGELVQIDTELGVRVTNVYF